MQLTQFTGTPYGSSGSMRIRGISLQTAKSVAKEAGYFIVSSNNLQAQATKKLDRIRNKNNIEIEQIDKIKSNQQLMAGITKIVTEVLSIISNCKHSSSKTKIGNLTFTYPDEESDKEINLHLDVYIEGNEIYFEADSNHNKTKFKLFTLDADFTLNNLQSNIKAALTKPDVKENAMLRFLHVTNPVPRSVRNILVIMTAVAAPILEYSFAFDRTINVANVRKCLFFIELLFIGFMVYYGLLDYGRPEMRLKDNEDFFRWLIRTKRVPVFTALQLKDILGADNINEESVLIGNSALNLSDPISRSKLNELEDTDSLVLAPRKYTHANTGISPSQIINYDIYSIKSAQGIISLVSQTIGAFRNNSNRDYWGHEFDYHFSVNGLGAFFHTDCMRLSKLKKLISNNTIQKNV